MPAGSDAIIDVYSDSSDFTIPSGYLSFVIENRGAAGQINDTVISTIGMITFPYVGSTYGALAVKNTSGDLTIFAIK